MAKIAKEKNLKIIPGTFPWSRATPPDQTNLPDQLPISTDNNSQESEGETSENAPQISTPSDEDRSITECRISCSEFSGDQAFESESAQSQTSEPENSECLKRKKNSLVFGDSSDDEEPEIFNSDDESAIDDSNQKNFNYRKLQNQILKNDETALFSNLGLCLPSVRNLVSRPRRKKIKLSKNSSEMEI